MTTVAIFDQKWRAQTRENDKSTEWAGSWGIWETVGGGVLPMIIRSPQMTLTSDNKEEDCSIIFNNYSSSPNGLSQ